LGGELFDLVPIDLDRPAAENRFYDSTAGAAGEITHNEYLERRIRFRGGIDPGLTGLDIHHHVGIRSFWHLVIP
jgi:hypothetical protein